jgi:hypothetical protein
MEKMVNIKLYPNVSKESLYEAGKRAGLTKYALENFIFANEYEIEVTVNDGGWVKDVKVVNNYKENGND